MTILEAHRVNKLAFRISPALQKAYHHQLEKEKLWIFMSHVYMKPEGLVSGVAKIFLPIHIASLRSPIFVP